MRSLANLIGAVIVSASVAAHAQNTVPSHISATSITLDDTVQLSVEVEGDVTNIMPPSTTDFRVVSRSTGTSMTYINGQLQRTMSARWILAPTRAGVLNTGPATVIYDNGTSAKTTSHNVTVTDSGSGSSAPSASAPNAMPPIPGVTQGAPVQPPSAAQSSSPSAAIPPPTLARRQPPSASGQLALPAPMSEELHSDTTGIDTSRPFLVAYVSAVEATLGQPILIEYVYFAPTSGLRYEAADLTEPSFVNAWFRDITDERSYQGSRLGHLMVNGQTFSAQLVRSYMVVPLSEGAFEVAPISLTIEGHSFTRRTGQIPIGSPKFSIKVTPPPSDGKPYDSAKSVGRLTFMAEVQPTVIQVGDVFNIRLDVSGIGTSAHVHLPDVQVPSEFRSFAPTDRSSNEVTSSGWVHTQVSRTLTFQATKAGSFTIPAITFGWFDPWKAKWFTSSHQPTVITVTENPNAEVLEFDDEDEGEEEQVIWTDTLPDPNSISNALGPVARQRLKPPFLGSPTYFAFLFLPVAASLTWILAQRWRRRRKATETVRLQSNAGKAALAELRSVKFESIQDFSTLARIARQYLALRISTSAVGATQRELQTLLSSKRPSEHAKVITDIVHRAEAARFGGGDEASFKQLHRELQEWIQTDEEFAS